MAIDIDRYNRSYEDIVETFEEEADNRLRLVRQQCISNLINRLNQRQREWDDTFQELLSRSQEGDISIDQNKTKPTSTTTSSFVNLSSDPLVNTVQSTTLSSTSTKAETKPESIDIKPQEKLVEKTEDKQKSSTAIESQISKTVEKDPKSNKKHDESEFSDPQYSNFNSVKEFVRIQELLKQTRESISEFCKTMDPELKTYRNRLSQFIKQHVNSITVDSQHLDSKIRLFTSLFKGQQVDFQGSFIHTNQHPQAPLFSLDFAAQTFVIGGTKIPEIAKSIATVIISIVNNNFPLFRDLVIGHLQERCPYLVPLYPKLEEFDQDKKSTDVPLNYKIACGYCVDPKKHTLESEEKYLNRMRSMTLMYASILSQDQIGQAWVWLASFLSLRPEPVISATILQAFLQEASKKMSSIYGRQYRKVITFIREDYATNIDQVTPKTTDRQSFVKLKNLVSNDSNLIAAPTISSIFGAIRQ